MIRTVSLLALLAALGACGDGQPLYNDGGPTDPTTPPDVEVPPGTDNPAASRGINRYEARNDQGGGYAESVGYDATTDTFTVDNLAFDGENVYTRDDTVPTLGGYQVYEAAAIVEDPMDGQAVDQLLYRAIVGRSTDSVGDEPRTQFAIVRTGSYVEYGFGGFVYERNGGVTIPTSGQAVYDGQYAGIRVFNGLPGLEYTTGDVKIAVDFEDFNVGPGVQGTISNRQAFFPDGSPVPSVEGNNLATGNLVLPDINFAIGPGVLTEAGEIAGDLASRGIDETGQPVDYESGKYYAIMAGDQASEIVGVVVVTSEDPRFEGVTAQETGGFIVYR